MRITDVIIDATAARIEVAVQPDGAQPYVELQRSADGGRTWLVVRGENPNDWTTTYCPAPRTLYDYEAPFDVPVRYRARGWDNPNGAAGLWSVMTRPYTLQSDTARWVLLPVSDATSRVTAWVRSAKQDDRTINQGVFYPLGRSDPVVTSDVRRKRTGSFTFWADDVIERDAFIGLAEAVDVVSVRAPGSHWWGARYVVLGDASWIRPTDRPDDAWDVMFHWTEVANPPIPAAVAGATYGDVADRFNRYDQLPPRFATYADLGTWVP